jgi:cytochrome c-type biogenesis protein CcmH
MRRLRLGLAVAVLAGLTWISPGVRAETTTPIADLGEKVPGAERLEGRLLAPCCWAQTLDIHGSEIANALRREIRTRLKAGESADAIEASLVARYGERLRAVPDRVPLDKMGGIGWLGVAIAAGLVGVVLLRWRKRGLAFDGESPGKGVSLAKTNQTSSEASDARLESELKRLDDS